MTRPADSRLELKRLTATEWVVIDNWFGRNDPRRTVACVDQTTPDEVEVVWLRQLCLPDRYSSVRAVFADIARTVSASSKPTPIPHRRPPAPHRALMTG